MENTQEQKAKFFALHWGQRIVSDREQRFGYSVSDYFDDLLDENKTCLELKPINQLTDAQALKIAEKIGYFLNKVGREKKYIYVTDTGNELEDTLETLRIYNNGEIYYLNSLGIVKELSMMQAEEVISFLRAEGVAYQWNGQTVEQMERWGWISVKN